MSEIGARVPPRFFKIVPELAQCGDIPLLSWQSEALSKSRCKPDTLWMVALSVVLLLSALLAWDGINGFDFIFGLFAPQFICNPEWMMSRSRMPFHPRRLHLWDMGTIFKPGKFLQPLARELQFVGVNGAIVTVSIYEKLLRVMDRLGFGALAGATVLLVVSGLRSGDALSVHWLLLCCGVMLFLIACHRSYLTSSFFLFEELIVWRALMQSLVFGHKTLGLRRAIATAWLRRRLLSFGVAIFFAMFFILVVSLGILGMFALVNLSSDRGLSPLVLSLADNPVPVAMGIEAVFAALIIEAANRLAMRRLMVTSPGILLQSSVILDANFADPKDPDAWRWALWFHDPDRDPTAPAPEAQNGWTVQEAAKRVLLRAAPSATHKST